MKAIIIKPGEPAALADVEPDSRYLNRLVGGWLEAVPVHGHQAHMYVNEDGHALGLEHNHIASNLARTSIVGTAVVLGSTAMPDEDDVPDSLIQALGLEDTNG